MFFYGAGAAKKETKEKIMELASNHNSDIEFLLQIYLKWFNSGRTTDYMCVSCHSKVPSYLCHKNNGCKACRTKFSNDNRLNNKIMETILNTNETVVKTISNKPQQNPMKNLPLTEIIGRCLIVSFQEQMGELLLPENPDAGLHLLDNGSKGSFSTTSVFAQKQQKQFTEVIAMKITQITNGSIIVDQVHPLAQSWIPEKYLKKLTEASKDMQECLSYPNLSVRYRFILLKEFKAMEITNKWLSFAILTYDNINATIKVYAPKKDCELVGKFCIDIIEKQKKQELQFETVIEVSNRSLKASFSSGMNIEKVEPATLSQIRVKVPKDIQSKEEFIQFICKKSGIKETDIKKSRVLNNKKLGCLFGDLMFFDKDTTERVKKVTDFVDEENYKGSNNKRSYLKISHNGYLSQEQVEEQLKSLDIIPLKVKNLCAKKRFPIFINNFPPQLTQFEIEQFLNFHKNPRILKNKYGCFYAILMFNNPNDRNSAFENLKRSPLGSMSYQIGKKRYSTSFELKEDKNSLDNLSQFQIIFNKPEEADIFSEKCGYKGEAYVTLRLDRSHLSAVRDYLQKLETSIGIKGNILESQGKTFDIELSGQSPKILGTAAQQIEKALIPIYVSLVTSQQHTLINEIKEIGLLETWSRNYKVRYQLSDDPKTGMYNKLQVNGNKLGQSQFMNEILNYFNGFKDRFISVPLPTNFSFLFKKDRVGDNFLKKINTEISNKGSVKFIKNENVIEIYVKPKQENELPNISKKIDEFIQEHSEHAQLDDTNFQSCVFCHNQGTQSFYICGHSFCSSCLYSETSRVLPLGQPIQCPKCYTPISLKDIKTAFSSNDELATIAQKAVSHYLIHDPRSQYAPCPVESCNSPRKKNLGYSICASCKNYSCPVCLIQNNNRHRGISCQEYQNFLKRRGEFDILEIIEKGKEFVEKEWDYGSLGRVLRVEVNPGLELGCPSMQRFCLGLKRVGVKEAKNGFLAWHGTSSEEGAIGICHNGFDPNRRSGQACGPGEYFGQLSTVSHDYAGGSNRMIVAFLLRVPETSTHGNFCYVVNNPTDWSSSYNLPLLVVTYQNNKPPVQFIRENKVPCDLLNDIPSIGTQQKQLTQESSSWKPAFRWFWDNDGNFTPYTDSVNALFEGNYENFVRSGISSQFTTPSIIRYLDDIPQIYLVDFLKRTQRNTKTGFERAIQRNKVELPVINGRWQFLNEGGNWQNFENFAIGQIENAFRQYHNGIGAGYLRGLVFPGRPEAYIIDFIHGKQINESAGTSKEIRRIA